MNTKLAFFRRLVVRTLAVLMLPASLLPAQSPRVTLPTRAVPANVVDSGLVPVSERMTVTLTVAPTPARAAALNQFLTDVITPSSPSFHKFVTPAQFAAQFGATEDQLSLLTAWAQSQGLTVDAVSPSGARLSVSGPVGQIQSAFATSLHSYQSGQHVLMANSTQLSLPPAAAALISAVDGLNDFSATLAVVTQAKASTNAAGVDFPTLAAQIDANASALLSLTSTVDTASLSASELAEYSALFRQAAAQGMTTLALTANGSFPATLPEVTGVALPGVASSPTAAFAARPEWQAAPGLPADGLRYAPDLTAASFGQLSQTLTTIAAGTRLGNINATLYSLATTPGLFTQPDAAPAGTWESATGLGLVDPVLLATVYPRGTGMSYTSFAATNYSPNHGQTTTFTSNVTSGTGGPTPTGTVSFVTSSGTVLGSAPLVSGTATFSINTLSGGNYVVNAAYSGDNTYASSQSPTSQIYIGPEPSQLSAAVTGSPSVGGSYTLTVTDAVTYGAPSGAITVQVSGSSQVYSATLAQATPNSSTAVFTIPAITAGTLTLQINCSSTLNYSCNNPYTTTVTISKATPVLSISYTPSPPISGGQIALNAVVTTVGTAPAPTGAVTFYDNGTTLNAAQLSNGSASTTGTVPTSTSHNITATYAGDPNYNSVTTTAGSTSSGTITTSTTLTSSATSVNAGQTITFTAAVMPSSTGPAAPSGTVQFLDNGTVIGTSNLSGNSASFATSSLSPSVSHNITAVYSGDGYYSTSTSAPAYLSPGTTSNTASISLAASSTSIVQGQNVTLTATVTPPTRGTAPTGYVNFISAQAGPLGQAILNGGVATFTTNLLPGGVSSITAMYTGDSTYNPNTSIPVNISVAPQPIQLSFSLPGQATFGSPFTVNVLVAGGSSTYYPTGTVTVQPTGNGYSAASSASVTSGGATSTGSAAVILQATGAGNIVLSATYAGDKNFAAAGPVSTTLTVARAKSSTTLTYSPAPPVSGQPITLTAKVSFASATGPTGTVQFLDGGTVLGTGTLDATGTAHTTVTLGAGNHVLSASYPGDLNYMSSTSPSANTSTGTIATTTALTITPTTVAAGASVVTLSASVGPTVNGTVPTGTVQYISGGNVLCSASITATNASCTISPSIVGTLSITANYLGDGNYAPSTSAAGTLTVTVPGGTLSVTLTPATALPGSITTATATVTAPAGTVPTGSIVATVTTPTGSNAGTFTTLLPGTGNTNSATVSIPITVPLTAGVYSVTVSCQNTNFSCNSVNLTLNSSTSANNGLITTKTVLTSAASTTVTGGTTLTATITPATAGAAVPTGTVSFYDGSTPLGVALLSSTGTATIPTTLAANATHSLTAVFSGDALYATSTSAAISGTGGTGTATAATITLTSNVTSGISGLNVVLTAQVTGVTSTGTGPTGTVSFYVAGTTPRLLGTVTVNAAGSGIGVAVLTTTSLPSGAQIIYAVYNGDTNFTTVTSSQITIGVTDFALVFTPPSLTLTSGQTGTATATVSVAGGTIASIALGCTPAPDTNITCSFSPAVLAGSGTSTLTVKTVQNKSAALQPAAPLGVLGGVAFATLLCFLLPGRNRRRIPSLLLLLLSLGLLSNLGCGQGNFNAPLTGGTPLGTTILTINTAGSDGVNTVRHTYFYQVTVQ